MIEQETNFNNIYEDIITKRLINKNKLEDISSGAYYRQLKQCQDKVISLLYSILLLRALRVVDEQTLSIIDGLADQIAVILSTKNSDVRFRQNNQSVMSVLDQIIKRMSKV